MRIIIIPVYNEEKILKNKVLELVKYIDTHIYRNENDRKNYEIVISDNNSTDSTAKIAKAMSKEDKRINYLFVSKKGRGVAIREASKKYNGEWYCYLDVDLPIKKENIKSLFTELDSGKYDLVSGTRHYLGGELKANKKRIITSRGYLRVAQIILMNFKILDIQLGFKGWNKKVNREIIPMCKDEGWFFDTEFIGNAFKKKCNIKYIPVTYIISDDGRKSSVKVLKDALKMVYRLIIYRIRG